LLPAPPQRQRLTLRRLPLQPLPPPLQRFWLFSYCVSSSIYRIFVGFAIILLVTYKLPEQMKVIGVLMGLGGVVTWLVVPVFKTFKYLAIEPELHRKRGRATAFTLAVATAVIVLVGAIPFWVNIDAVAVVEPAQGYKEAIYTKEGGFVREIRAKDGQWLKKGDVILVCENIETTTEMKQLQAELNKIEVQVRNGVANNPSLRAMYEAEQKAKLDRRAVLQDRLDSLTVRAPIEGELVAPHLRDLAGKYIPRAQELAMVQRRDKLAARVVLKQDDVEPVVAQKDPEARTEVRMAGDIGTFLKAESVKRLPHTSEYLPSPAPGVQGGGDIPTDPHDPSGAKPTQPQFEVVVTVDNPELRYAPGQQAYVRFKLDKRPLIWQWGRWFWQLIQTNSTGNNA
jgi:putative peptide zinc metalloprotease protein